MKNPLVVLVLCSLSTPSFAGWKFESGIDELTDRVSISAHLATKDRSAVLLLVCHDAPEAYEFDELGDPQVRARARRLLVTFGLSSDRLFVPYRADKARMRFGNEEAFDVEMKVHETRKTVWFSDFADLHELSRRTALLIRVRDFSSTYRTLRFQLPGGDDKGLGRVLACIDDRLNRVEKLIAERLEKSRARPSSGRPCKADFECDMLELCDAGRCRTCPVLVDHRTCDSKASRAAMKEEALPEER